MSRRSSLVTVAKPMKLPSYRGLPDTNSQANAHKIQHQMPEATRLYANLKKKLREEHLFEKQPHYYTRMITVIMTLLVTSITLLFTVHNFALQLFNAIFLAFVTTQLGLLGHDAGHRQIFHDRWKNRVLGLLIANVLLGISNTYWTRKHDEHHSNPNQIDVDPDLDIPLLAFAEQDIEKKGIVARCIIAYQHFFFFPLLALTFVNLKRQCFLFLCQNKRKARFVEVPLLLVHYAGYTILLFSLFNAWQAILFIIIHQGLTGLYMGSIFAPNHKGMPMIDSNEKIDFLHRQILTARNVKAHPIIDFWYGGLNYQIEHHLFPTMPRNNLKAAQIIIQGFCVEHTITYTETSFIQSYREILTHLRVVSVSLRPAAGLLHSINPFSKISLLHFARRKA